MLVDRQRESTYWQKKKENVLSDWERKINFIKRLKRLIVEEVKVNDPQML
ncbi:MAG: hypothetical protein NZ822_02415 [Patescibacteria group bacterium]|nr:hypothetical protein [Patescibacteria group bacterium]